MFGEIGSLETHSKFAYDLWMFGRFQADSLLDCAIEGRPEDLEAFGKDVSACFRANAWHVLHMLHS